MLKMVSMHCYNPLLPWKPLSNIIIKNRFPGRTAQKQCFCTYDWCISRNAGTKYMKDIAILTLEKEEKVITPTTSCEVWGVVLFMQNFKIND